MAGLTHNQLIFRDRLAARLGLDKAAVGAWIYHEQNGAAAQSYENRHYYNWLNIGRTDSGDTADAAHDVWSDPTKAADATVHWIETKAAPAIRNALASVRGKSAAAQVTAIANSPWASSHYGGPQGLISLLPIGARGSGGGAGSSAPTIGGSPSKFVPGTPPTFTPAKDTIDYTGALTDSLLAGGHSHSHKPNSGGLLKRMQGMIASGAYTTSTPSKITDGTPAHVEGGTTGVTSTGGGADASTAEARANAIDAKHMPYLWGGGHQHRIIDAHDATPLDCSGAVSAVLGINPRVAAQFEGWGSPGDGGNRGVTIYAKGSHVLMKINGHFFGTSATNPGGGAGWIPQGAISPGYLKGFVARHSAAA